MSYKVYQLKIARQVYDYVNEVGHAEAAVKYPEYKVSMTFVSKVLLSGNHQCLLTSPLCVKLPLVT